MTYTIAEDGVCVCDDCGAYADKGENVVHHDSCNPGESEKWKEFYEEACPDCGDQLVDASSGGVKCSDSECGYWFCF